MDVRYTHYVLNDNMRILVGENYISFSFCYLGRATYSKLDGGSINVSQNFIKENDSSNLKINLSEFLRKLQYLYNSLELSDYLENNLGNIYQKLVYEIENGEIPGDTAFRDSPVKSARKTI
jgi:hypothetical protein